MAYPSSGNKGKKNSQNGNAFNQLAEPYPPRLTSYSFKHFLVRHCAAGLYELRLA